MSDDPVQETPSAFDRYVVPEIPLLYRVARSLTDQPSDAEDLVQDTLIRAYRAIERFDGAHPRTWLLTILRHTHLNRMRGKRAILLHDGASDESLESVLDRLAKPSPSAEEVVVDATFEDAVSAALGMLSERHRHVVELVDVQGLSYQVAADRLGIPRGTVMSRLHRARARIREQLAESGVAPKARRT